MNKINVLNETLVDLWARDKGWRRGWVSWQEPNVFTSMEHTYDPLVVARWHLAGRHVVKIPL